MNWKAIIRQGLRDGVVLYAVGLAWSSQVVATQAFADWAIIKVTGADRWPCCSAFGAAVGIARDQDAQK